MNLMCSAGTIDGRMHTQETNKSMCIELDVAIVGSGPGGLCCALAVRRALGPDVRIGIFDKASSFRYPMPPAHAQS